MGRYSNVAPIESSQDTMPEGVFPLILCTTRERLAKTLTVLWEGGKSGLAPMVWNDPDSGPDFDTLDHIIDLLRALSYIDDPQDSPCYPTEDECKAPFWDSSEDESVGTISPDCEDATEEPWYTNIADWIVSSFIASTASPGAAIVYKTLAPRVRLALRTSPDGAPARILVNNILVGIVNTVAPQAGGIINVLVDLNELRQNFNLPNLINLVIEHGGQ